MNTTYFTVPSIIFKLKIKLSDVVSQFKLSTFVELQLTGPILFKISEGLSKLTLSVEVTQFGELM